MLFIFLIDYSKIVQDKVERVHEMRNRRNTRKRNVVLDTITNRNFIIIVSILLAVIIVAEGVIQIRKYQEIGRASCRERV